MRLHVVGVGKEFAHHYRIIGDGWCAQVVDPAELGALENIDLAIFANEFFTWYRDAVESLRERRIPTIYTVDGILEWRNSWEFPLGDSCQQTFRPVLADKVACIGRSQVRILESWGNLGKCELVGVPRFDSLAPSPGAGPIGEGDSSILIMTAKNPGFTDEQRKKTLRSLADLKRFFDSAPVLEGREVRPLWRLTQGLEDELGVRSDTQDTTGRELAETLGCADAVITTSSTAMLEAMRFGLPTALLDYHQCPHYVPAAWTISCSEHIPHVVSELMAPPAAKMLWQDTCLHDALECRTPAMPRLAQLIEQMAQIGRECRANNRALEFPIRILHDEQYGHHLPEPRFDLSELYPHMPTFQERNLQRVQVALSHCQTVLKQRESEIELLQSQLNSIRKRPVLSLRNKMIPGLKRFRAKLRDKMLRERRAA